MDARRAIASESMSPGGKGARGVRVLVVDDDVDSRQMLEEAVTSLGHECIGASDGKEAFAMQQAQAVDVILSDWSMPEMTGVELCRRVRARESAGYTRFVLMTAFGDREHLLEGLRAGADDYLTKPVDLEELEARLVSAMRVITQQRALARRIAKLGEESQAASDAARRDPLTQISNRLQLREDLAALRSRVSRYGHRYCASITDVDFFKSYNDAYGHVVGDEVLRRVADTIRSTLRQGDTVYRYGGEEFLAILPEQTLAEAGRAMDRVRAAVAELAIPHAASPVGAVTVSVGVAEMSDAAVSHEDWLHRADVALYRAKREGRNRVVVCTSSTADA
jgi:two-component system, cell cycle response regulator